jgi:hypothetical protein
VLIALVDTVAGGVARPVTRVVVKYLAELGAAAAPAAPTLRRIAQDDHRHAYSDDWRRFLEDEELRKHAAAALRQISA